MSASRLDDEKIRGHCKDSSRLTDPAKVAEHDQHDESKRHLDTIDVPLRKCGRDCRHSRRNTDGYGQNVIDQERACGHECGRLPEIVLRDDVCPAAVGIRVDRLAIGKDHDRENRRDDECDGASRS